MKKSAKTFLAIILISGFFWSYNNLTIKITEQNIVSSKVNADVKIAVLSDLHGLIFGNNNSIIINKVKNINPDLIFVLGDMYSTGSGNGAVSRAVSLCRELGNISPVYVVTGEHDDDEYFKQEILSLKNVNLMNYKKKEISVKNNSLCIYGIDNVHFTDTFDLHNAFKPVNKNKINILLAHIPHYQSFKSFNSDLIFCGDTHGGMIRLPKIGAVYYDGMFFPRQNTNELITDKGLFEYENTKLFVTSGLGGYPVLFRLNNRPEICSITLKGE